MKMQRVRMACRWSMHQDSYLAHEARFFWCAMSFLFCIKSCVRVKEHASIFLPHAKSRDCAGVRYDLLSCMHYMHACTDTEHAFRFLPAARSRASADVQCLSGSVCASCVHLSLERVLRTASARLSSAHGCPYAAPSHRRSPQRT